MSSELPGLLDWAWRKGHSLSSGNQIAPEVKAVAVCVGAAVAASIAANSCAHTKPEKAEAALAQQEDRPVAVAEIPQKFPVPEIFRCTHTCAPYPNEPKKPAWLEKLDREENKEKQEWDKRIRVAEEAASTAHLQYTKDHPNDRFSDKLPEEVKRRNALEREKYEWEKKILQRREEFTKRLPFKDELERYKRDMKAYYDLFGAAFKCQKELKVCQAKEKETTEFAADISQINSVEPLALNMDIVPSAARSLVERYMQFDRQFCDGFPATAGEFIKLKSKWASVTRDFGRFQHMVRMLDARFQQYGAFEAFYAMQDSVGFDAQFSAALPPEIFAVINADFQRKTKIWWKYVREDVRGLMLTYDTLQAQENITKRESAPRLFGYERSYEPPARD